MDRRSVDACILALAGANGMVVTTAQLNRAGIGHHLIEGRRGGLLVPVARGVYAVGDVTPAVRLRAVVAVLPHGAGSHHTAGSGHALPLRPLGVVEVATLHRTKLVIEGVRLRTTNWLPADDVTTVDGVRMTSVARTLCDLAAVVTRSRLRHLLEVAITGAWPELRVLLELDGRRWHSTVQAQVDDRRRDRAAVARGWVTLRFGWQEIVHRPASVVDECRTVLAARLRALGGQG